MNSSLREQRILKAGSPMYSLALDALAPGATKVFDLQSRSESALFGADKYLPLDFVEITNDDTVAVYLIINQVDKFYVPASTIKAIEDKHIWNVAVQNLDATTATGANKIRLLLQRKPVTVDKYLRRFQL